MRNNKNNDKNKYKNYSAMKKAQAELGLFYFCDY